MLCKVTEHAPCPLLPPPAPPPAGSLAMAHPNCISIYHLSTLRLLRGEGLLDAEHGRPEGSSAAGGSPLRSLLSSTEAEEVADPSQPLQPGLYETWIVSEVGGAE